MSTHTDQPTGPEPLSIPNTVMLIAAVLGIVWFTIEHWPEWWWWPPAFIAGCASTVLTLACMKLVPAVRRWWWKRRSFGS